MCDARRSDSGNVHEYSEISMSMIPDRNCHAKLHLSRAKHNFLLLSSPRLFSRAPHSSSPAIFCRGFDIRSVHTHSAPPGKEVSLKQKGTYAELLSAARATARVAWLTLLTLLTLLNTVLPPLYGAVHSCTQESRESPFQTGIDLTALISSLLFSASYYFVLTLCVHSGLSLFLHFLRMLVDRNFVESSYYQY